jgi:hypothetical protein
MSYDCLVLFGILAFVDSLPSSALYLIRHLLLSSSSSHITISIITLDSWAYLS